MGVVCGKNMAVNGEKTVFYWEVEHEGDESDFVASGSEGGVSRLATNVDWVGYFDSYGQSASPYMPTVFPGDSFTFTAVTDTNKGVTGTAMCERLVMTIDLRTGGYVEYRTYFGANGALTVGAAVASDTTEPKPQATKGLYVALDGSQQGDVNYMRLIFTCGAQRYCSAEGNGQYKRTAGCRTDVDAFWRVYEDTPADLPTLDAAHVAKFYVTSAQYWQITWVRIKKVRPIVDLKRRAEPVGAEITAKFVAQNGTAAGSILDPAGATQWP